MMSENLVDAQEATEIAQDSARQFGWPWGNPISVTKRGGWLWSRLRWVVESNTDSRGCRSRFVIDARTGMIIEKGYINR